MRHDGVVGVDVLHELPDDAIRRDGILIRGQRGHPLIKPFLPHGCDFLSNRALGSLSAAQYVLAGVNELAQHELCVA